MVAGLSGCGLTDDDPDGSPTPSPSTTGASSQRTLADFYAQTLTWSRCQSSFECATIEVPLDYDDPGAGQVSVDLIRLKARNARGSLLLNPGGPGGSGIEYARAARFVLTDAVVDAYDIVGFDPRGVVGSDPVECVTDAQLDALIAADGTPDDAQEIADLEAQSQTLGVGCKEHSPAIAAHMDTVSAAKDMDLIRAALGDDRLNLLGKSYGTFLGATYAGLFPERVGRMVLDGALPSDLNSDEVTLGQAKAFDLVLQRFVADCQRRSDCPLPTGSVEQGVQRVADFLKGLDADPLPGVGDRELNESLGTYAILSYLYFPPTDWDLLRSGLRAAFEGDGSVLMDMMDDRVSRSPNGTYQDNGNEAFYAVSCLDRPAVGDADHAAGLAREWVKEAPVFGPYLAWGNLPCWQWPFGAGTAQAAGEPKAITAPGAAPILVVSTKYDPATPYEWGVKVADQLESAALLSYDGDGHTAYVTGSQCIDILVDAYLLEGALPAVGTVCRPDPGLME